MRASLIHVSNLANEVLKTHRLMTYWRPLHTVSICTVVKIRTTDIVPRCFQRTAPRMLHSVQLYQLNPVLFGPNH